jgi:hypothetical protein
VQVPNFIQQNVEYGVKIPSEFSASGFISLNVAVSLLIADKISLGTAD